MLQVFSPRQLLGIVQIHVSLVLWRFHFVASHQNDNLSRTTLFQLGDPLFGIFQRLGTRHIVEDNSRVCIPVIHAVERHQVGFARDVDNLQADLFVVGLQIDRSLAVLSGLRRLDILGKLAPGVHTDERCLA